jgi:hypothetical protein
MRADAVAARLPHIFRILIVASSLRVDFTAAIQNCPGILDRWTQSSLCFGGIAKNLQELPAV